jgi:hypothetical protein
MNAQSLLPVDTDTFLALLDRLRQTNSILSLGEAAALAIRAWLASDAPAGSAFASGGGCANASDLNATAYQQSAANAFPEDAFSHRTDTAAVSQDASASEPARGCRGYQWKELFLPDGTDVRMRCDGEVHHARVSGDSIVYRGRPVSPRQLTLVVAGDGRNAWRDLSLRLPGEKRFQPASLLRHRARAAVEGGEQVTPQSPAATIAAAAATMSDALRTALQLVEHSNAQSLPKYERRGASHRRADDVLAGQAAFD